MRVQTRGCRQAGFTLLEMVLATSVFAVGSGAAMSALLSANYLARTTQEQGTAVQAAQTTLERVRGVTFEEAFARFNDTALDDPAGGVPGADFAVPGLTPQLGDPDGFCGRVTFPGNNVVLLEDGIDRELGMPRDLSLDDVIDNLNHSADYAVLPVRITVAWRGVLGDAQVSIGTTLVERQ